MVQRTLFNVQNTMLDLWDSVIMKRINLQQLKLDLKLNSILNDQVLPLALFGFIMLLKTYIQSNRPLFYCNLCRKHYNFQFFIMFFSKDTTHTMIRGEYIFSCFYIKAWDIVVDSQHLGVASSDKGGVLPLRSKV